MGNRTKIAPREKDSIGTDYLESRSRLEKSISIMDCCNLLCSIVIDNRVRVRYSTLNTLIVFAVYCRSTKYYQV